MVVQEKRELKGWKKIYETQLLKKYSHPVQSPITILFLIIPPSLQSSWSALGWTTQKQQ